MTAYLVWLGVSYNTIGTLRGISSVIGLLGTMAFAISVRIRGLAFTGFWVVLFVNLYQDTLPSIMAARHWRLLQ